MFTYTCKSIFDISFLQTLKKSKISKLVGSLLPSQNLFFSAPKLETKFVFLSKKNKFRNKKGSVTQHLQTWFFKIATFTNPLIEWKGLSYNTVNGAELHFHLQKA